MKNVETVSAIKIKFSVKEMKVMKQNLVVSTRYQLRKCVSVLFLFPSWSKIKIKLGSKTRVQEKNTQFMIHSYSLSMGFINMLIKT